MGATVEDIETWLGRPLPEPYRSFLAATPRHYLAGDQTLVYGLDNLVVRNETYRSRDHCPGHLMVADDSGGSAVVLSLASGILHRVGMGAMTEDCFKPVARDFAEWASRGFALPDE